jgi:predicted Zn finger-like uncharacterized protein
MATLITSCPNCKKQIKIPEEITGKKIKCKGCGNVFVAVSTAVKPDKPNAQPKPAGDTFKTIDDDEEDGKPYGVTDLDLAPRCPFCAEEMEEDAVICLHCGYNTESRQHTTKRRVQDTTGMDWFWWLLPAILNIILFFVCFAELINVIVRHFMFREEREKQIAETWGDMASFGNSCNNCCALWLGIFCIWIMYLSAKFVIKRMVFHFHPPEKELN